MEVKIHPFEIKKAWLLSEFRRTNASGKLVEVNCEDPPRSKAIASPELALLAIYQMLRTGMLGIPGLAHYMQMCRRTRDDARVDWLWRVFVRARYPNHPFEVIDRGSEGNFFRIDAHNIKIAHRELESRKYPCSTQLNTQELCGRNDFQVLCTNEESLTIVREAGLNPAFEGGLFPEKIASARRKLRRHSRRKRKPPLYHNSLVIIDLCRPYLVKRFSTVTTRPSRLSLDSTTCASETETDQDQEQEDMYSDFWSGRTENFEKPADYRFAPYMCVFMYFVCLCAVHVCIYVLVYACP